MTTPLTAGVLLEISEREARAHPRRQAILLLAAYSGGDPAALAALPLGEADARLAELRQVLFGPRCDGRAACPSCGEAVEFGFAMRDVFQPVSTREQDATAIENVAVRLPTSADLLNAARARGKEEARERLLAAVTSPPLHGAASNGSEEEIARAIVELDPNSDVQLALCCPACAREWSAVFDIACWLVAELRSWSRRVLQEVHSLARAYGWSEAEILAMSATRRQSYLQLVGAGLEPS